MNLTQEDIELYTPRLLLTRHTGAIIFWYQTTRVYRGEPEKLRPLYNSVMTKNLIFGWWSPVSLFVNPIITANNKKRFNEYVAEYAQFTATPEQFIVSAKQTAQNTSVKNKERFKKWRIPLGIAAAILVTLFIWGMILDS